jgi:omega-6 fatty acid desaturase (delta-12 desaturase)
MQQSRFTSINFLNKTLGILAFLPTLHNFKLWEHGHNHIHHGFTNLREVDYVYKPLSPDEYVNLTGRQKRTYRLYRSVIGHLFYYLIEIWIKKMTNPNPFKNRKNGFGVYLKYQIPVALYFILFIFYIFLASHEKWLALYNLLFLFVIPFLVWNWIMGFIIFQHHNSPDTKWYSTKEEWGFWEAQLENTIHVRFPNVINFLFHNIMEHNAHHSNTSIPLYHLISAQSKLEEKFGHEIKTVEWSLKYYLNTIKKCKLYDYENHRWITFDQLKTSLHSNWSSSYR